MGEKEMDEQISAGNGLRNAAHEASDPSERRAKLKAAYAAFLAAERSIDTRCNPAIVLRLGQIAEELGEIEQAIDHLEPLLCAYMSKVDESPGCIVRSVHVRQGRELLEQLKQLNLLLDVTPNHATVRLTSTAHVDVPLPAPVSDLGWRRLPPGEYILTLSAPQHSELSVPLDLRGGARFKQPLVLEPSCDPSSVDVDEASGCPPNPPDTFARTVGVLVSARGLLRDIPSGGATNLLATLLLHPQLAIEAGAELAPQSVGGRAGASVIFGREWFASLQAGGSVLAPTGDAARLGAKTLGGMHIGLRGGYSEPRWAAFVELTAEYFPMAGVPAALLAGGGVQWRFWALK